MLDDDALENTSLDAQLLRAAQLDALREEYSRLWRAAADPKRIYEVERLLERLLASPEPLEMPAWLVLGEDGPLYAERTREDWTRTHLVDPALIARGWADILVRREEWFVDYRDGKPRRVDYALRLPRRTGSMRLVALIEAKAQGRAPHHGLEQAKNYADGRRERIRIVFSTNGHHYVEYDRRTKVQSGPFPLSLFPTPMQLAEAIHKPQPDSK